MQQLDHVLHIAHLVREKLHDCFVAAHLTELAEDKEDSFDFEGDLVGLVSDCFTDVELQEFHDWRDHRV